MFCASVDLPVPLGPVSTTLVASLRKSSCISASIPARSQPLGQSQSKSHRGLKRPIWAARMRRSRLRRARSSSSQPSSRWAQPAATASSQLASRPCRFKALALARRASLIGGSFQLIVEFKADGPHGGIFCLHMGWQVEADGGRLLALLAAAFQSKADGILMGHIAAERLGDGGLKLGGAVALQQLR